MITEQLVELSLPYPGRSSKTVRVFVPDHEEGERLPVIYMTDGQNLFNDDITPFGCWYTREAVRAERRHSGKAAIIVGVHNDEGAMIRTNDLTPASIGLPCFPSDMPAALRDQFSPQGEVFDRFVVNTVMPAIEARFPVKTDRSNTAFCGSSSGGLQAFFTALSHPDRFSAAGVLSPAFPLYFPDDLHRWIASAIQPTAPYLYLYSGGADALEQQILQGTEQTYNFLKDRYPSHLLRKIIRPDQPHNESAWEPIFRDFLHIFLTGEALIQQ